MELWSPIVFLNPSEYRVEDKSPTLSKKEDDEEFNFDFFFTDDAKIPGNGETQSELESKASKSTTKKSSKKNEIKVEIVDPKTATTNGMAGSTDVPYASTYSETDNMIRGTIMQIDILNSEIKEDINKIRGSSTMKSKYTYLTNLTAASSSLMATKLNAIRELNNSITQAHNLELKRAKDLKQFELDKQNDDSRMMDLYSAFINAPMGMYDNKLNMPTIPDMMVGPNDPNSGVRGVSMGGGMTPSQNETLTPEQVRLRMEGNSNIEEIVVYDPATGRKWFDVIDKTTGQSVPNYPRSDAFLLDDISIESRAGVAKNRNLDRVWPLHIVGNSANNFAEY